MVMVLTTQYYLFRILMIQVIIFLDGRLLINYSQHVAMVHSRTQVYTRDINYQKQS